MKNLQIEKLNLALKEAITLKLNNKAKPVGSLGKFEDLAMQVALIQNTLCPELIQPIMLTVAADHGITEEGVSPCPTEITWQQVENFVEGGGGIGLFTKLYDMELWVVDAGVNYDFKPHPKLIDAKVAYGSNNFLHEPAMSEAQCLEAINHGRSIVKNFSEQGSNVIGFGEMGIGNTSPASVLLSIIADIPLDICVGPGSGLTQDGVVHKTKVLEQAISKHGISDDIMVNLANFGGYEIACIAGGMLEAASNKMLVIVDGFITTSALLVAYEINPNIMDYCVFSHQSKEQAHELMLEYVGAEALLNLNLRLGEGTGSAVAYSLVKAAVAVLNEMTSFEEGKVHNTSHIDNIK